MWIALGVSGAVVVLVLGLHLSSGGSGASGQLGEPIEEGDTYFYSVAFSPNGRILASAGDNYLVQLWDVRTHRQLGAPLQHPGEVSRVAFSPNGRILASACDDGAVRLWDRQTLRIGRGGAAVEVRTYRQLGAPLKHPDLPDGTANSVRGIAFSPNGHILASLGRDGIIRLWDVRTHKQLGAPLGHLGTDQFGNPATDTVNDIAFSPDGRTLASANLDHTVRLWDVGTHRQLAVLRGHTDTVWRVAFSPDGRTLVSASEDTTIRLWDVGTHRQLAVLRGHTGGVTGVAFSPDGRTLASASNDTTIRLWDVGTHRQLGAPLRGHTDTVWDVAFSPNGRILASAGNDGTVRLWDVSHVAGRA